jgi:hypothetical protein
MSATAAAKKAKKQPSRRPAKRVEKVAKRKVEAESGEVTLEQFREAAKEYLRADENVTLYKKRRDAQTPVVRAYVDAHAAEMEKGKSRGLVDNAVKWMLVPGAMRVDEDAGMAVLQREISKATGDRKRILQACIKQTIDKAAWERAKAVGFVTDEMTAEYEKGRSHALKWSHTDQVSCPKCRAVANRTAKFCSSCGADLTKSPDFLK